MPRDFWVGLVALGFAIFYWFEADKIRISPLDDPVTAAGLPKALGVALGVLAVAMIARSLLELGARRAATPETGADAGEPPEGEGLRPHLRAVGILAIGVGYLLLVPFIGYALGIISLILAVSVYIGARLGVRSVVTAVLGGVFFHLLFVEFLGIPLPEGTLLLYVLMGGVS